VVTIFPQISVTKREAEIELDETDFFEKKMINKRKKLILEGMDPEEADEFLNKKKKRKKSKQKKTDEKLDEDRS
jgi:ATP-dependent RNA helicase DDX49/DBP8